MNSQYNVKKLYLNIALDIKTDKKNGKPELQARHLADLEKICTDFGGFHVPGEILTVRLPIDDEDITSEEPKRPYQRRKYQKKILTKANEYPKGVTEKDFLWNINDYLVGTCFVRNCIDRDKQLLRTYILFDKRYPDDGLIDAFESLYQEKKEKLIDASVLLYKKTLFGEETLTFSKGKVA